MIAHSGLDHLAIGLAGALAVGVYGWAWILQPRPVAGRLVSWVAGVVLVVTASLPWFEELAARTFTGHMVQHLLVIVGAAPLLVVARPIRTAMQAGWIRTTVMGRRVGADWHRLGPVLGPALFVAVLFATHLTSIYDRALDDRLLHEAEHAAYLTTAVAMWSAVLGVRRHAAVARMGAVFGVIAGGGLLGMILLAAASPLMPTYEARLGTERALDDQRAAAALMWISGMLTTLPLLVLAVWNWAATEERIARRTEALGDAAVTTTR